MSDEPVADSKPLPLDPGRLPEPVVKPVKRGRFSLVWLVPIIALITGGALVIRAYVGNGPKIKITFETAEGIEGGKTEVRYRNVVVGHVTRIDLKEDRTHVVTTVQLTAGAKSLAVEGTRFWIERPRVGLSGISGVGTLLSGAYINVDIGGSQDDAREFIGLEKPPGVLSSEHGRSFKLVSSDAGSLAVQSPVYYRRVAVGLVSDVELSKDGKQIELDIFIDSPYDQYVTEHTVFWNASGVDLTVNADGLKLDTQSLATVLAGGIAFQVRAPVTPDPVAKDHATFPLFDTRVAAFKTPDGQPLVARMRFQQTLRGLTVGTTIDFGGVSLGEVTNVALGFDGTTHQFYGDVTAEIFPERLGTAYTSLLAADPQAQSPTEALQAQVERGLRAQMRSGNLLTGAQYIAWDFFPRAKPVSVVAEPGVIIVPTEVGAGAELQDKVQDIVSKLDAIPFADIGNNMKAATARATTLLGTLDTSVAGITPEAKKLFVAAAAAMASAQTAMASVKDLTAADSPLQDGARGTLEQIQRAAYSLRTLSDYLAAHPESLVRGRASGAEPNK